MGQFEPIHGTRHVDIREDETDFRMFFEPTDGLIGIPSFVNQKASVLELRSVSHPNQRLVFNDENGDKKFFEVPHLEATPRSANSSRVPTHQIAILSTAQWIGRSTPVYAIGRHDAGDAASVGLRRARPRNRTAFHLFDDGARNIVIDPHPPLPRNRSAQAARVAAV
jgi:hypothetical protein